MIMDTTDTIGKQSHRPKLYKYEQKVSKELINKYFDRIQTNIINELTNLISKNHDFNNIVIEYSCNVIVFEDIAWYKQNLYEFQHETNFHKQLMEENKKMDDSLFYYILKKYNFKMANKFKFIYENYEKVFYDIYHKLTNDIEIAIIYGSAEIREKYIKVY